MSHANTLTRLSGRQFNLCARYAPWRSKYTVLSPQPTLTDCINEALDTGGCLHMFAPDIAGLYLVNNLSMSWNCLDTPWYLGHLNYRHHSLFD